MGQLQSEQQHDNMGNEMKSKNFASLSIGVFFLVSSLSIVVVISMFIFVWQPIWAEGFKDFHTISNAIDKLDKTAKPATETIPEMLEQMANMNKTMNEMVVIMQGMDDSIEVLQEMTPNIKKMSTSIDHMTMVMTTQLGRMTYLLDRIENKLPSTNMLPFW